VVYTPGKTVPDDQTLTRNLPAPGGTRLLLFWEGGSEVRELRGAVRLVFGRGEECDVRIRHDSVSRKHAVVHGAGPWSIEDLGSSNGTIVGGKKLVPGEARVLEPGVVVSLGAARLLLDASTTPAGQGAPRTTPGAFPSAEMERIERLVGLVADSVLPVLLLGETGVGKGTLATRIHERSSRAARPFVQLNCAAVPEGLLESELFGHERGAFTGATQAKPGILESANGGTVFLDEVGEIPRPTQAKLLHVLEQGKVQRLGSVRPVAIDVRFLSATNRDLDALVASGQFRRDLYYRLAGVPVHVPPLRERRGEIPEMARAFVEEACARTPERVPLISEAALRRLCAHDWPGNIRELRNVVMRAALLSGGSCIEREHLLLDVAPPAPEPGLDGAKRLAAEVRATERQRIAEALDRFGGHQGKAADYLGISRRTLSNKLDELGLPRPRKKHPERG
jgi:two-component system, NtrC family, response regulator AtoC